MTVPFYLAAELWIQVDRVGVEGQGTIMEEKRRGWRERDGEIGSMGR